MFLFSIVFFPTFSGSHSLQICFLLTQRCWQRHRNLFWARLLSFPGHVSVKLWSSLGYKGNIGSGDPQNFVGYSWIPTFRAYWVLWWGTPKPCLYEAVPLDVVSDPLTYPMSFLSQTNVWQDSSPKTLSCHVAHIMFSEERDVVRQILTDD